MPFPVSGKLKSKDSHYAIIEYGNGECDLAMLAIDGGTAKPIILEINFY
jgi:hypothetical protein